MRGDRRRDELDQRGVGRAPQERSDELTEDNVTTNALPTAADRGNQAIVALTPADMAPAQTEVLAWCDRKIASVRAELADLEANLELATEHGWKHQSVAASLARTRKRIRYYEKIQAAVAAGYLIVPNFPINIFAVRVQRSKQPEQTDTYAYKTAKAELLPAGEGRYVDEQLFTTDESYDRKLADGKTERVSLYRSGDYDEVDFPVVMVKPVILAATGRAMALKIFDEMGLVQNSGGRDPIVVGRLLDPRGNNRCVTFFVAWWLDTASL
jgi:hypothetical protein